jgi:FKBP-type peptidyl-prolyl cis-trans isomerase SlyD
MTKQTIQDGIVVTVAYSLTVDGEVVEEALADDPFEYLHGAMNIVPGLEAALTGKTPGEKITVVVQPADGYGEYDDESLDEVAKADIPDADELEEGMIVMLEDEDGDMFEATITEIKADSVILDFNDPLAGKVLNYEVEVLEVRNATEQEVAQGFPESYMLDDDDDHDHDDEE